MGFFGVQGVIFIDQASEKKYKHLWTQQRKLQQKSCGHVPLRSNMELKKKVFHGRNGYPGKDHWSLKTGYCWGQIIPLAILEGP